MERLRGTWQNTKKVNIESYVCGYCGKDVAAETGISAEASKFVNGKHLSTTTATLRICPSCNYPTTFYDKKQFPEELSGSSIGKLPDNVAQLYDEARKSISATAYTGAVLCCRKLLMHIATDKGAKENLSFVKYVEYLHNEHYIPPNAKAWVDYIRNKGNEANHEIVISEKEEAKALLLLVEMLLKIIYELPNRIPTSSEIERRSDSVRVMPQHS